MTMIVAFTFCLLLACSNSEEVNNGKVVQLDKKQDAAAPTSVDSRFFDLGGIIEQLFPGLNQGNQGGPGRNPPGMDFPANSQFYPAVAIQEQPPSTSTGQGSNWPVIDDAKQYPNQAHINTQMQLPNPGAFVGSPQTQYPNQGNFGGSPQVPNMQYPNQGNFGGLYPNQRPSTPIFGGRPTNNGQFPSQGFNRQPVQNTQFPNQGNFGNTQFPQTSSRPQNPNMFGSRPLLNSQYPWGSQSNPPMQFPNQINNGNPRPNQFLNQGGFMNGNQNNPGRRPSGGDGTLDGLVPPEVSGPSGSGMSQTPNLIVDQPVADPDDGRTAILGNPVRVPSSTEQTGIIKYPTSTDSPAKKQCVQDCQTTSEYNPVCGSDNVTYINPGKFVCARNCGINVFVARRGRCPDDTPNPPSSLCSSLVERKVCTV